MTRIRLGVKAWLAAAPLALLAGMAVTQVRPATRPAGSQKAPADGFVKKTYTYKTVGQLKIQADVYCAPAGKPRPVVVNFHGGALITGNRQQLPGDVLNLCRREGYALVSVDYRLAPEVKLPEIIADVKDGFRWIREKGPELFQADPSRIVVAGSSAGGYLTLMTGICIEPGPLALVAYWGYGDMDGDWVSKPGEYYRKHFAPASKEEAMKAYGEVTTGEGWSAQKYDQRKIYARYLRQNGLWTKEVSGFDPATEPRKLDPYCPVRNVTAKYPPTFLVHGTDDTDVPVSKAEDMARELKRAGVAHELIIIPKAGHRLDGGDKELVAKANQRALKWISDHIEKDAGK